MYATGNIKKKTGIFSTRKAASSLRKEGKRDCCFFKCMKMGSTVSKPHQQNQQATAKLEHEQHQKQLEEEEEEEEVGPHWWQMVWALYRDP